jgi:NhaP-type Na+/H+ or K+/H+ antiporter
MDFLLNIAVFMWLGAVCPWDLFLSSSSSSSGSPTSSPIPSSNLFLFGIAVLLLRRLPVILALRKWIPQIRNVRHALIMGFFGPIGVSAIFYLCVTLDFLQEVASKKGRAEEKGEIQRLADVTRVAVWFLVVASVVSSSPGLS